MKIFHLITKMSDFLCGKTGSNVFTYRDCAKIRTKADQKLLILLQLLKMG